MSSACGPLGRSPRGRPRVAECAYKSEALGRVTLFAQSDLIPASFHCSTLPYSSANRYKHVRRNCYCSQRDPGRGACGCGSGIPEGEACQEGGPEKGRAEEGRFPEEGEGRRSEAEEGEGQQAEAEARGARNAPRIQRDDRKGHHQPEGKEGLEPRRHPQVHPAELQGRRERHTGERPPPPGPEARRHRWRPQADQGNRRLGLVPPRRQGGRRREARREEGEGAQGQKGGEEDRRAEGCCACCHGLSSRNRRRAGGREEDREEGHQVAEEASRRQEEPREEGRQEGRAQEGRRRRSREEGVSEEEGHQGTEGEEGREVAEEDRREEGRRWQGQEGGRRPRGSRRAGRGSCGRSAVSYHIPWRTSHNICCPRQTCIFPSITSTSRNVSLHLVDPQLGSSLSLSYGYKSLSSCPTVYFSTCPPSMSVQRRRNPCYALNLRVQ